MSKILCPFTRRQFTNIVQALALAHQHTVILTLKGPLSEQESSTQEGDSGDKVDDGKEDD